MSKGKKIAVGVVIGVLIIVIAVAVAIPLLLNVDRYRPTIVEQIRQETGKAAEIGHLSLTVFPTLAVRVDNFALGNPGGFPEGALLKVRTINGQLDAGALWNRAIVIKALTLDEPVINLVSDAHGRWNFENTPQAKTLHEGQGSAWEGGESGGQDKTSFTLGVIGKLQSRALK